MSFEVAAVHATLGFKVEGAQETARAAGMVEAALRDIEAAAQSSSARVRVVGEDLRQSVQAYEQIALATARARGELEASGQTLEGLQASLSSAQSSLAQLDQEMANAQQAAAQAQQSFVGLTDAQGNLLDIQRILASGSDDLARSLLRLAGAPEEALSAFFDLEERMKQLAEAKRELQAQLEEGIRLERLVSGRDLDRAAVGVETLRERFARLTTTTTRFNQTALSGFISAARTGNIGSELLARGLRFVASAGGVVAIAIGLAVIQLVMLTRRLLQAADAANSVRPAILDLARSLQDLEGVDVTGLAGQLGNIVNRMQALGATNPEAVAADFVRMGTALALLDDKVGNADEGIKAIQQAIERLNFEQLKDFGVPVAELERQLEGLGDVGENVKRQFARDFIAAFLNSDRALRQMGETAERESKTMAGVGKELQRLFDAAGSSDAARFAMEKIAEAARILVKAFQGLFPIIGALAAIFVIFATVVSRVVGGAMWLLAKAVQGVLNVLALFIPSLRSARDAVAAYADELGALILGQEEIGSTMQQSADDLYNFGDAADDAARRFKEFRDNLSGGFGLVGNIRNIAQALRDMEDGLDPGEAFAYFESIDRAMATIAERGVPQVLAGFEAMRRQALNAFRGGLIDEAVFQNIMDVVGAVEDATGPLIKEVERLEDEYGVVESASQGAANMMNSQLTPSLYNTATGADVAAASVRNLQTDLNNLEARGGVHIPITISTSGAPGAAPGAVAGFGRVNAGTRSLIGRSVTTRPPVQDTGASIREGGQQRGAFNTPPPLDEINTIRRENEKIKSEKDFTESVRKVGDLLLPRRGGGGGGGGGRGRDERLATIEQIREFFNQVNAAILSGIRGGRVFSTAGDAIPLGGAGQFISSQGGVLIESVNLRGVWDFADPTAKREIVRQLKEALKQFESEVA